MKQIPITAFPFGALLMAGSAVGGLGLQHGSQLPWLGRVTAAWLWACHGWTLALCPLQNAVHLEAS